MYVINTDGSGLSKIANGDIAEQTQSWQSQVWSPDGSKIVYFSKDSGNIDVWRMNPDGSGKEQLTTNSGEDSRPIFSPDGKRVIFQTNRNGNWDIYAIEIATPTVNDIEAKITNIWGSNYPIVLFGQNAALRQVVSADLDSSPISEPLPVYTVCIGPRNSDKSVISRFKISDTKVRIVVNITGGKGFSPGSEGYIKIDNPDWRITEILPGSTLEMNRDYYGSGINIDEVNGLITWSGRGGCTACACNENEVNMQFIVEKATVIIDNTAPITEISISGTAGNNGWNTSDVQVTLAATDEGGSGVDTTEYTTDGVNWIPYTGTPFTISAEGTTTISYRSTDKAGNIEEIKTQTIKIDKNPPVIAINIPADGAEYFLNQPLNADWSASDGISGLASATGTLPSGSAIDTSSPGTRIFTVNAADSAGNTDTRASTYNIRYNFGGILQPINADGSSVFKLGSTILVKFRLTDASGNSVTGAVARIYIAKISDGVTGTEMEASSTSAATNLFRYDSTGDQYIFNLGTKTLSTGTWQLRIELGDGTSKYVTIGLK